MWEFSVTKTDRLDRALRQANGSQWMSRQAWDWLLQNGRVRVNGQRMLKGGTQVGEGSRIQVEVPERLGLYPATVRAVPAWIAPDLSVGAFVKPAGVDSVALFPWDHESFASQICAFAEGEGICSPRDFAALSPPPVLEGGLLQRLDRDTSGLLLSAFTSSRKALFRQLFSEKKVGKEYLALTDSYLPALQGEHRFWLDTGGGDKVKAFLDPGKKELEEICLNIEILKHSSKGSLLKVTTKHGARHVVRATLAALGAPLLGDRIYGGSDQVSFHQLHASRLFFPFDARELFVEAPPPQTFLDSIAQLGLK